MNQDDLYDIIIAGGGLAGLISAIELHRRGLKVLLIERRNYPFHKVCGEYVSNEIKPYLQRIGVNFNHLAPADIRKLRVSSLDGKFNLFADLQMGGFGISRYELDFHLYSLLTRENVPVLVNNRIKSIDFSKNVFHVKLDNDELVSKIVIGSYGKRSILDKQLNRDFINSKTGYMAVKYHIKTDYPENEIGLDNFKNGYCGISKIEKDKYCLCYLTKRSNMNGFKSIKEMEEEILYSNDRLKYIFKNAQFLFENPEVINEISFSTKNLIENHILMCGDSAGMITPLCGNGMAIAVHSAKLLAEIIASADIKVGSLINDRKRIYIENAYSKKWNILFSRRIYWGRKLQYLSGNPFFTNNFLKFIDRAPIIKKWVVNLTHGRTI